MPDNGSENAAGITSEHINTVEATDDGLEWRWLLMATREHSVLGLARVTLDGQLVYVNKRLCEMVGYTKEELLGSAILSITCCEDYADAQRFFRDLLCAELQSGVTELRYMRKDGSLTWLRLMASLISEPVGMVKCFVIYFEDISEYKRTEEEQARFLVGEREARRRIDEFLALACHELKSPLSAIKGNVQLAMRRLRGASSSKELEVLQLADRQINRLSRLVSGLLDVSRIRMGKMAMNLQPCDLVSVVSEAIEDQRITVPAHLLILRIMVDGPMMVLADADRIGQVVTNYVCNAIKYSGGRKLVEVCVRAEGLNAYVAVYDQGPGLADEQRECIWERFHRLGEMAGQYGTDSGLGLGLYICKTIIEEHHGGFGVESVLGQGSTFWFTLPLLP
ncbi:PAS domain S-box protein [Ktedonosporobacter rubrisoli]|uniref:histidine kinase n=1 Tax=Ktedonosporobacter rubrisoli TaxID=2509675 RepID=A0A4P6JTI0_KTERU|nr:HAMP domain-containing sensor histidine kinase [Ktedonosporobacter rubrisoli]QBD78572.1 PAS domain S-box protein [Ktedonosporobacter rubrisoli]